MKGRKRGGGSVAFTAAVRSRDGRASDARVVLEGWSRSGLKLGQLARRHALDLSRLRRWHSRLGQEVPPLRFHPVEVRLGLCTGSA